MSAILNKHKSLVESLYEKTMGARVSWDYEPSIDYLTSRIGRHLVELEEARNKNDEILYKINIRSDGEVVDSFSDETFKDDTPIVSPYATYFELMQELREVALRQAKGTDRVIDEVIAGLEDI